MALEFFGEPLPLPGLRIAEIVAERAKAAGRRYVADSTRLLVHEAVAAALEQRTPEWYGGPLPLSSLESSRL